MGGGNYSSERNGGGSKVGGGCGGIAVDRVVQQTITINNKEHYRKGDEEAGWHNQADDNFQLVAYAQSNPRGKGAPSENSVSS